MAIDKTQFPKSQFFTEEIKVHSYDSDFNQNLSIKSFFNFLQEIAWEHAQTLGYGWEHLMKNSWFWALVRMEADIFHKLKWTDKATLVTWPRKDEGIFAYRDFELYNSEGVKCIAASSSWLVLNVNNRRPVRLSEWYNDMPFSTRQALNRNADKLKESDMPIAYSEEFPITVGDIDMNGHVNNVRYIDWAYNAFPVDHYKKYYPEKVAVNFNAEALYGDNVKVELRKDNLNSTVDIVNPTTGKNNCRINFQWKELEKF